MPLPNFLIVGAPKCGTTSLWYYLRQHPDVYFAPYKEPNYFALAGEALPDGGPARPEVIQHLIHIHSVTDLETYGGLFRAADGRKAIGEASVRYLYYEKAAGRIHAAIPDVRMIAILREPVGRLFSHYCMNLQNQLEPLDLGAALAAEEDRRAAGWGWDWHYTRVSSYSHQIKRFQSIFDPSQLKVFLYDDLVSEPLRVFRESCRHLGIDDRFAPDMSRKSKMAYRPHNLTLDRWLHWPNATRDRLTRLMPRRVARVMLRQIRRWNRAPLPKLDAEIRSELGKRFHEDVLELEELLGRKTHWLKQTQCLRLCDQ